uniref:Uncharacterized protein n=1 Tax=Arundo donax TaxID=35708 RepID=A0A0A9D4X0_ARUDO
MFNFWCFILQRRGGRANLSHAHFLHRRWVDDGHWNNVVVSKATFPVTVLLTIGAPVQTAMDQANDRMESS